MAKIEDHDKLTREEIDIVELALRNGISGCSRASAKAGLDLVRQAYAQQQKVLTSAREKLRRLWS